ncbi:MAG TPA: hypothetical protein VLM40_09630, partial [Gemmata sp.]|nr:hypothetical protein [Gemmata sp.]
VIVVLLGAAGVLFRWVAAPPLILIVLTYFLYCPFGIPEVPSNRRWDLHERRFALLDVIFVMSVLVYVVSHYRIMSFLHQAIAADGPANRRDAPSLRRPPALIAPAELGMLLGYSLVFVLIGQLVWWFVTSVEVVPTDDFLIRWVGSERFMRSTEPVGVAPPRTTIFFVVVGMVFFGTLLGRVVFRYWRLRVMGAAEAGMILLDGGWDETKRECSRVEKWRTWGKKRAEARSKLQADEEEIAAARERAEKSRAERRRQEQAERRGGRTQRSRNRGMR